MKAKTTKKKTAVVSKEAIEINVQSLHLLGNHILVRAETLKRGLVVIDQYEDKKSIGIVTRIGHQVELGIEEDDLILFGEYATVKITFSGEDYLLVRDEDVIGVVK